MGLFGDSDTEEGRRSLLMTLRKLLVPLLFVITVLMNWGHPIIIAAKVTIILLTTKPSPLSVYVLVEQVKDHSFYTFCPSPSSALEQGQNSWIHRHFLVD